MPVTARSTNWPGRSFQIATGTSMVGFCQQIAGSGQLSPAEQGECLSGDEADVATRLVGSFFAR